MATDLRRRQVAGALAGGLAAAVASVLATAPAHAAPLCANAGRGGRNRPGCTATEGDWATPGEADTLVPGLLGAWEADEAHYAGALFGRQPPRGVALPFRPHHIVRDPVRPTCALVVARRPGDYIARIDWHAGLLETLADTDPERVFEGHAAFSTDGAALYTVESDTRTGAGLIGVRAAATLAKTAEWRLPGIGPHALLPGAGGSLWVALGGILTLPETGRTKRNVDRMEPALLHLSADDGRLLGRWRLDDPRLGIRHLALSSGGTVGVALQAEHDDDGVRARAPVLALLADGALIPAQGPPGAVTGGYGADIVCVDRDGGGLFAVSCPRAGCVALWDEGGRWRGSIALESARALATCQGVLIAAGDDGCFVRSAGVGAGSDERLETGLHWDNHMTPLAQGR